MRQCLPLTQSGHERLRTAAVQTDHNRDRRQFRRRASEIGEDCGQFHANSIALPPEREKGSTDKKPNAATQIIIRAAIGTGGAEERSDRATRVMFRGA